MKKLLLSIVCAFTLFALSAQVSDNFSDYTVGGGKLAQQAQAMGRDYWSTWGNKPGTAEDGAIVEQPAGNKALYLTYGNDQLLRLGKQSTGTWIHSFKIYVPANKDAYFNVQANFTGDQNGVWAFECYMAMPKPTSAVPTPALTPGIGNFYAGKSTTTTFNFTHDTWIPMKVIINLDDDVAKFYVNDVLVSEWQYTLGNAGAGGCPKVIDAFNMYPPSSTSRSSFYIDDIVFEKEASSTVIFETGFDDQSGYVAQKYPEFWQTWSNKPGTPEDALISNEQSVSPTNSAKCVFAGTATNPTGTDLVFKTGEPTTGAYTVDFDMYIPDGVPAYFNLLNNFVPANPNNCLWAIGVYFNIKPSTDFPATGTYIQQNDTIYNFTAPSNTWFPISMFVDLDQDIARISINGTQLLEWQYSIGETGDPSPKKLAAVDFYPPQPTSVFYIDNFKYAIIDDVLKFPIMGVTPSSISEIVVPGQTITKTITVENTGTAIGEFYSEIVFNFDPPSGNNTFNLAHCGDKFNSQYSVGFVTPGYAEFGAKFLASDLCDKMGAYITKMSYYLHEAVEGNEITFRIYAGAPGENISGELLMEFKKTNPVIDGWTEITLPTPVLIDKTELWLAVSYSQIDGTHPIGHDDPPQIPGVNWFRRTDGSSWTKFWENQGYGNVMIKAFVQGGVIPACWIGLNGTTYGSVPKGTSKTFDVELNAKGIAEGAYKASIIITTSDTAHLSFTIPCTMLVGASSVTTVTPTTIMEVLTNNTPRTIQMTIKNTGNIAGNYTVAEPTVDWLTISGNTADTLSPGASKTFNVGLSAEGIGNGTYTTTIKITTTDIGDYNLIPIPCTLIVNKVGVGEYNIKTLVFPNPATNNVTIQSNYNITGIQIVNFVGQKVYSSTVTGDHTTVNTSNFKAGIYFIRVNTEVGSQSVKLIVK